MKKFFQIFGVFFVLSSIILPQRVFDQLLISDEAGGSKILMFGLDSLATDGIDIYLAKAIFHLFHQSVLLKLDSFYLKIVFQAH